jgi:hypothetical protein
MQIRQACLDDRIVFARRFPHPGREFDDRAADLEQAHLMLLAPTGQLPQVKLVSLAVSRHGTA